MLLDSELHRLQKFLLKDLSVLIITHKQKKKVQFKRALIYMPVVKRLSRKNVDRYAVSCKLGTL